MERWEDFEAFLRDAADRDLCAVDAVAPCLVASEGPTPLLLANVRPFAPGGYQDPLLELIAVAAPLGADRLAVSMEGRARMLGHSSGSGSGPPGDDGRRVLVVQVADGAGQWRPRTQTLLQPFERTRGGVRWEQPQRVATTMGWVPTALRVAVTQRRLLRATPGEIVAQAERCAQLGHALWLAPAAERRLGASALSARGPLRGAGGALP